MRDKFRGFYSLTEDEFSCLWKKAFVVFDASVLLNLYRYPVDARNQMLDVMDDLGDRIWIPYQVGLEYQSNRASVIADQRNKYDDVVDLLEGQRRRIANGLEDMGLRRRHAELDPETLFRGISSKIDESLELVRGQAEGHATVNHRDRVRERLDKIFEHRIGDEPDPGRVERLQQEAAERYSCRIPPGYLDADKGGGDLGRVRWYGGSRYDLRYGDYLVWRQVLDFAEANGAEAVIFVTDDAKDDWWWIERSRGPKTLGPRPELVDEIGRAGVSLFHMYNSEQFLRYARQHLNADVSDSAVSEAQSVLEQARDEAGDAQPSLWTQVGEFVGTAALHLVVLSWLKKTYRGARSAPRRDAGLDATADDDDGGKRGFSIKFVASTTAPAFERELKADIARAEGWRFAQSGIECGTVVYVFPSESAAEAFVTQYDPFLNATSHVELVCGFIRPTTGRVMAEFVPVHIFAD